MSSVIDEVPRPSEKSGFGFFESSTTRSLISGLSVAAAWSMVAALAAFWPDRPESDWAYTGGWPLPAAHWPLPLPWRPLPAKSLAATRLIVAKRCS
ncbi:hypothetical protein [Bradyrhizobium japonicum]|uniref:hypothetical protein n=1 Tax=Bradyrhizobium japonicum TaxID=375 RepID=UPI002714501C|nr:hypothetical protein [Bradyrhizobium japonicum]WLB24459.1 hypothetical protein QIH95_49400 [Bradyrhizobium japonicum]